MSCAQLAVDGAVVAVLITLMAAASHEHRRPSLSLRRRLRTLCVHYVGGVVVVGSTLQGCPVVSLMLVMVLAGFQRVVQRRLALVERLVVVAVAVAVVVS